MWAPWRLIDTGEARVVQLFGGYRGTVRTTGLRWVNLFAIRRRVSVRIRNKETPTVKVNDADGNPIEIAAVVVWQGRDTARATYGVEDFLAFVDTQSETALRHVANGHPHDDAGSEALSLRRGSPGCHMLQRSPRSCCNASRRVL